jgi:4-aminobutyrate aminotransferase-like enzyme
VDTATGEPATERARDIRDELRERGVLVGTTRREKNVLKIRPPLAITAGEARLIVRELDQTLGA